MTYILTKIGEVPPNDGFSGETDVFYKLQYPSATLLSDARRDIEEHFGIGYSNDCPGHMFCSGVKVVNQAYSEDTFIVTVSWRLDV